jgi:hypothetical protein
LLCLLGLRGSRFGLLGQLRGQLHRLLRGPGGHRPGLHQPTRHLTRKLRGDTGCLGHRGQRLAEIHLLGKAGPRTGRAAALTSAGALLTT